MSEINKKKDYVIVRLLTGILRGCEFRLAAGRTLFLVTDERELRCHHQGTVLPENMIVVPSKAERFSFEVSIIDEPTPAIKVTELLEQQNKEYAVTTNQLVDVNALKLAFRYADETFSDEIESFRITEEPHNECGKTESHKPKLFRRLSWLALAFAFVLFGLFYITTEQRHISSVASLLNKRIDSYDIISGKDGTIYVIASDVRGVAWASQALARSANNKKFRVLSRQKMSDDIALWFASQYPQLPLRRILTDVSRRQPVIELSQEQDVLDDKAKEVISRAATVAFPYLEKVNFSTISDFLISNIAEQGLKKIAVPYTRKNSQQSVTFVIQGSLDDSEFERLKLFVENYYAIWRGEYVQFAIEVKDDWLKGKSFKYGSKGYVKMSPGHWYFPKPL